MWSTIIYDGHAKKLTQRAKFPAKISLPAKTFLLFPPYLSLPPKRFLFPPNIFRKIFASLLT
jgi:hypothetical protein